MFSSCFDTFEDVKNCSFCVCTSVQYQRASLSAPWNAQTKHTTCDISWMTLTKQSDMLHVDSHKNMVTMSWLTLSRAKLVALVPVFYAKIFHIQPIAPPRCFLHTWRKESQLDVSRFDRDLRVVDVNVGLPLTTQHHGVDQLSKCSVAAHHYDTATSNGHLHCQRQKTPIAVEGGEAPVFLPQRSIIQAPKRAHQNVSNFLPLVQNQASDQRWGHAGRTESKGWEQSGLHHDAS